MLAVAGRGRFRTVTHDPSRANLEALAATITAGRVVDTIVPLDRAAEAVAHMASHRAREGCSCGSPMAEPSPRRAAFLAGVGLLSMAGLAGYANLVVIAHAGEATAGALAFATAAMGVVAGLDVLVAWALWKLLRSDAPGPAALSLWTRLVYAVLLALAVARLASGGDAVNRAAAFHAVFDPALGLFGVHLVALAAALARTRFAGPRLRAVLAVAVAIAGLGYLVDAALPALLGGVAPGVGSCTFVGELVLMAWLLSVAARG